MLNQQSENNPGPKSPSTIGVWIEWVGAECRLGRGSSRVLALLIGQWLDKGVHVVVALPQETRAPFLALLEDLRVRPNERLSFVSVYSAVPGVWRLARVVQTMEARGASAKARLRLRFDQLRQGIILQKLREARNEPPARALRILKRGVMVGAKLSLALGAGLAVLPFFLISRFLVRALVLRNWKNRLRCKANRAPVGYWLVPSGAFEKASELSAPLVVWAIDSDPMDESPILRRASRVLVRSAHMKERLVSGGFGLPPEKVETLHLPELPCRSPRETEVVPKIVAKQRVERFCHERFAKEGSYNRYLCDFPFADVDTIFAPSTIGSGRNFAALLHAFAWLVRRHRRDLKLIVTGRVQDDPEVMRLLREDGLSIDVMVIPEIPTESLGDFYRAAEMVVVPSLFEAGFPFVAMEALRAGTPVALPRIPVVMERIGGTEFPQASLFDPSSVQEMVRAIEACLDRPASMQTAQSAVIEKIVEGASWETVCDDLLRISLGSGKVTKSGAAHES